MNHTHYPFMIRLAVGLSALIAPGLQASNNQPSDPILSEIFLNERTVPTSQLPGTLKLRAELGLATFPWVSGSQLYEASNREGGLYETRATVTPKGDTC